MRRKCVGGARQQAAEMCVRYLWAHLINLSNYRI